MFDNTTDDDDALFAPVSNISNLATLFGTQMKNSNNTESSTLTYTAPKQPTCKAQGHPTKNVAPKHQSTLLVFKEIHAFKLVEKNYLNQGKCGLALIGNDKVHIYQLLLYKHKNDIISTSKLSNQFQFIIQKDNYATFSDDQSQKWTVHFNCDKDLDNFAEAFEFRGAKVVKTDKTVDTDASKHDSDPNPDNTENSIKANILSRMAKMGQKLLPNNSISDGTDSDTDKDKAPCNKPRKPKKIASSMGCSPEIAVKPPTVSAVDTTVSVPVRPQTINPQIPNSQIVTMVQQQPYLQDRHPLHVVSVDGVTSPVMYGSTPNMLDHLQMHFSENRTQNSEVRMNLLRLTTKMEEMLNKVNKIDNVIAKTSVSELSSENSNNNTESLKWENEKLKQTIKKLKHEIEDEQHKITADLVEKSSSVEKALKDENEELKQNIDKLTQALQIEGNLIKSENIKLKSTITKLDQKVALLKDAENKTEVELHQQMLNIEKKQKTPENIPDDLRVINNKLKEELAAQKSKELDYEIKIKELEQQASISSKELSHKISVNKQKFENLDEIIKKIMNGLYYEMSVELQDDQSVVGKDVKQILARKIVDNTYSILSAVSEISVSLENSEGQNTTE